MSHPHQTKYGNNQASWFDQKHCNGLHYNAVYQKLDDLTNKGFTAMQIEEILNLGEKKFNKNRLKR